MADLRRNLGIPSGVVFQFAGTTAPYGYLICDGSAISRADYPDLFLSIGTAHGSGDGSTTFNLPDYRGRFIRGYDGSAGVDPDKASRTAMASGGNTGNAVGSVQGDTAKSHQHFVFANTVANGNYGIVGSTTYATRYEGLDASQDYEIKGCADVASVGLSSPTGGNETRPKNATANFIIKI